MRRVGDRTVSTNQRNAAHEGRFDKVTCNSTSSFVLFTAAFFCRDPD